ncbi:hypothetical protein D3C74_320650 [compost metagenome]
MFLGFLDQGQELGGADHAGFVDDHHVPRRQLLLAGQEPVHSHRFHPDLMAQQGRCFGRGSHSNHVVIGLLHGVYGQFHRGCFTGTSWSDTCDEEFGAAGEFAGQRHLRLVQAALKTIKDALEMISRDRGNNVGARGLQNLVFGF